MSDEKCPDCGAELEVISLMNWPRVRVQKGTNTPHTARVCLERQLAQRDEKIKRLQEAIQQIARAWSATLEAAREHEDDGIIEALAGDGVLHTMMLVATREANK